MASEKVNITAALVVVLAFFVAPLAGQQLLPRIINGEPTDLFPEVGIVGTVELGGFCTGTLISARHVLTAAHCAQLAAGPTDGTFQIDGQLYTTSQIFIHPDFNSRTLENDLAIYELSEPIPEIVPAEIFRGTPEVGDQLMIVGFGAGGTGAGGQDGTFGTKRVGTTTIDAVTDTLIIWEFESEAESNTAPGDSGGPGFLLVDGQLLLASVTSAGTEPDAGLGDVAFNTRVDAYAAWIDSVVSSAGAGGQDEDEAEGGCPGKHPPRPVAASGHHRPHPGLHRPAHRPAGRPRPGGHRPAIVAVLAGGHRTLLHPTAPGKKMGLRRDEEARGQSATRGGRSGAGLRQAFGRH